MDQKWNGDSDGGSPAEFRRITRSHAPASYGVSGGGWSSDFSGIPNWTLADLVVVEVRRESGSKKEIVKS
jgi:hypothetical protein